MFVCEKCKKLHDGMYGSGRFCSSHCARSFSTFSKRSDINKRVSETLLNKYKYKKRKQHILTTLYIPHIYLRMVPNYSDYLVDVFGNVFNRNIGRYIKQFNSNGYKQVVLNNGERRCLGVHQVVAMTFLPDYFDSCIVHHCDKNKKNNFVGNLSIMDVHTHARYHVDRNKLAEYTKKYGPHNKGKKMSKEFCIHCKESATKRNKHKNK